MRKCPELSQAVSASPTCLRWADRITRAHRRSTATSIRVLHRTTAVCGGERHADRQTPDRVPTATPGPWSCGGNDYWLRRAKADGMDVLGCTYWRITDNYEWRSCGPCWSRPMDSCADPVTVPR